MSLVKTFVLLFGLVLSEMSVANIALRNEVIESMYKSGRYVSLGAYVDSLLLLNNDLSLDEKIRLTLISAISEGKLKNLASAYARVEQARELFVWSGFQEKITYDDKARKRIESSIDLVLFDLRNLEMEL